MNGSGRPSRGEHSGGRAFRADLADSFGLGGSGNRRDRPQRDDRPSYADRARRDDPARKREDSRYRADDDGYRSRGGRRDDRRDDRPRREDRPRRDDRPRREDRRFGQQDRRDRDSRSGNRPRYGDRNEGQRDQDPRLDDRPRYDDRGGGPRQRPRGDQRDDRPRRNDSRRDERPRYGHRDERPHRGERTRGDGDPRRDDRQRWEDRPSRDLDSGARAPRERPSGSRIRPEDIDHIWPEIPEWVDLRVLGPEARADLRGLSKEGAEFVGGHLAAAAELVDEDPDLAWEHARAARSQGGRIAVVRETVGLVAYRARKWAEALTELRAARRMAGGSGLLAVMADAERALGNPDKAIELAKSPEAQQLDPATAAELTIVVAGARSDLGQHEAARAALRQAARAVDPQAPFAYAVYYAYAAKLADLGETDEALSYFVRAADADAEDETDAAERAQEIADQYHRGV